MRPIFLVEVSIMSATLFRKGYEHAHELVEHGQVMRDQRDDWSEHRPSAEEENEFIRRHSMNEFGMWHLGIDSNAPADTKAHWKFPYGDFKKVHRCALISAESRAGQFKHLDIEKASKDLLEMIDAEVHSASR
jgi:hypothetical protein